MSIIRITTCCVAALLVAGALAPVSAQSPAPAAPAVSAAAKPSKMKLTRQSLRDMRAKWSQNKGKLKACRADVKAKGLAGDDRWFYIEDCMGKG